MIFEKWFPRKYAAVVPLNQIEDGTWIAPDKLLFVSGLCGITEPVEAVLLSGF
jgi:hypothetical protein